MNASMTHPLTKADILDRLLNQPLDELMAEAREVLLAVKGDAIHLRGIVEFSSHCVRDCLYCGLRRDNRKARRIRLSEEEILGAALYAVSAGVDTVVLQSGDDLAYRAEDLAFVIHKIKSLTGAAVTVSCGERPFRDYVLWREAGADRYLMRHETADPDLYARLHPGRTLDQRLTALRALSRLGYETGAGCIVGLPGQTPDILAQDVMLVRELGAAMCGVGPLLPQAGSGLPGVAPGSLETTLRMIALIRLACPGINIPATTALASLDPARGHSLGLLAGANVIMPVFTPDRLRGSYRIYDGKIPVKPEDAHTAAQAAGRRLLKPKRVLPHA